jgi:hypothetical protein
VISPAGAYAVCVPIADELEQTGLDSARASGRILKFSVFAAVMAALGGCGGGEEKSPRRY